MTHHPHVHCIVPGGGISLATGEEGASPTGTENSEQWVACRPGFFLPVRVLSRLFRRLFLEKLAAAHRDGSLQFFSDHLGLVDRDRFAAFLAPLRKTEWVVYAKRPFAGPEAVLAYLARYTHRVAISNSRLTAFDGQTVTFKWKDYRAKAADRQKLMTLEASEFIRRFLLHVLPKRLHRIRYYGLFANAGRAENLAHARKLLHAEPAHDTENSGDHENDADDGTAPQPCPACGGPMIVIDTFAPGQHPHRPRPRAPPTAEAQAA
jgi:hypothetical protein